MRTKTLLGLAVLAASAATVVAQNNVYSLNIVGYVNQTVPAGSVAAPSFALIGNPLKASPDNKVTTVIGTQLPDSGVSVLTFNGLGFQENGYYGAGNWDNPDLDISPGVGFFVKNTTANPVNITFVGEVLAGLQTNAISDQFGFSLISPKVPVAGDLYADSHLNFTNVVANDSLLFFGASGYSEDGYYGGGNWDFPPVVSVGQGFFYKQNPTAPSKAVNWVTVGFP